MENHTQRILELYDEGKSAAIVGHEIGLKAHQVYWILKREGIECRSNKVNSRRYEVNHSFFSEINNEKKAYWLGFLYADSSSGCYDGQYVLKVDLSDKDQTHLVRLAKDLSSTYPVHLFSQVTSYGKAKVARLAITSHQMVTDLWSHGCHPNKTHDLNPPNIDDEELIRHFIRGFVDGDGSVAISGKTFRLKVVGTHAMMSWLKQELPRSGSIMKHKSIWALEAHRDTIIWLYKDSNISLDRKYERAKQLF